MSIRLILAFILVLVNVLAFLVLRRGTAQWVAPERKREASRWLGAILALLNFPLLAYFIPAVNNRLDTISPQLLRAFFYPATAWLATLMALALASLIVVPLALLWRGMQVATRWMRQRAGAARKEDLAHDALQGSQPAAGVSRRSLLAGGPGLLVAGVYGVSAYGVYANMDQIDVSKEIPVPIPNLPRSLEGMTIVQISDLHAGPFIRARELKHVVSLVNQLRPDIVAVTGDVLDRSLSSLPDAVSGLQGIRAALGSFAVLGNHDYYADRYSYSARYRGGIRIQQGLDSIGIRTLRNEVVHLESGGERLALMGLDWLTVSPTDRNFYSYKPVETRHQLGLMMQEVEPGTPRVLLAHHPDTFKDTPPEIGLTLSGHTHGGGQVIFGNVDGVPIGIATLRFKYLSGLYERSGSSLYVNRGIGYLGIPLRINCPPEISRFKLIRSTTA